jgi:hypothetical protein
MFCFMNFWGIKTDYLEKFYAGWRPPKEKNNFLKSMENWSISENRVSKSVLKLSVKPGSLIENGLKFMWKPI